MSRTKELLQEYAESEQCVNAEELFGYLLFEKGGIDRVVGIVAERYARECCKASLQEASSWFVDLDVERINNPENIILL